METEVKCFIAIDEQPAVQPTYIGVDCSLLVDDNDLGNFFGVRVPCEIDVTRNLVGACVNTSQGIRVTITVDDEDVSDSLVGQIMIKHNLNYISSFSFSLGDPKYSPLIDSHIVANSVVIITVFINGQEIKMFTGLVDDTKTTYAGGYRLTITGRDYGKKLLDKTMTLISVQESAQRKYRGSIVKYLASQAGVTSVNVPQGDAVSIDHSFQDQSIWDMIQKECAIEGWQVRFDENGVMQVKTRTIKTDTGDYPTVDWEYGEDKFVQLGLEMTDQGIINKVIILGAIFEEETITIEHDEIEQEVEVPTSEYNEDITTIQKSFTAGENVPAWSYEDANFKVTAKYVGYTKPPGYIFPKYQDYSFTITKLNADLTIMSVDISVTGGATKYSSGITGCQVHREITSTLDWNFTEKAFDISIAIKTKEEVAGGSTWITENIPNETTVSTITYTQVKAIVTDNGSIALYGERKPNNEGTLPFPLAETTAQCKRIGENIILDSHRFIKQPDFKIPFNPKLIVGHTVELTDKKIGYDESRYLVEEAIHYIDIDKEGKIKARTRIGCVFYA